MNSRDREVTFQVSALRPTKSNTCLRFSAADLPRKCPWEDHGKTILLPYYLDARSARCALYGLAYGSAGHCSGEDGERCARAAQHAVSAPAAW
jgi:hypothetical protein